MRKCVKILIIVYSIREAIPESNNNHGFYINAIWKFFNVEEEQVEEQNEEEVINIKEQIKIVTWKWTYGNSKWIY